MGGAPAAVTSLEALERPEPGAAGEPIPAAVLCGFGVGSLATGLFSTVPGFLLLFYMTEILHVPPALAGLAVGVPKLWSIVTDPLIGVLSDRTRSRFGRRRPFILGGGLAMAAFFAALFNLPAGLSGAPSALYEFVAYAGGMTAYAAFSVPYLAIPAEASPDPHVRTRLISARMMFVMLGIMLGMAAAPALVQAFGGGRHGYSSMSWLLAGVCMAAVGVTFWTSARIAQGEAPTGRSTVGDILSVIRHDRAFASLLASYVTLMTGVSVFTAAAPYFNRYILGGTLGGLGTMFLVMLSAAVVAMPVWTALAGRIPKRTLLYVAAAMFAAGTTMQLVAGPGLPAVRFLAVIAAIGAAFGGLQLLPFALLADHINAAAARSETRREGIFTGLWTSGEKVALACGPLIVGVGLDLAQRGAGAAPQLAIHLLFALGPGVFLLGGLGLLRLSRTDA